MTTKTDTEQERAEFEAWIISPPYEKPVTINPDSSAWPGQYRGYEVQLAWEAYQAGRAECEKLRACLAETAGVAVTMLYESHKADTVKEFTVEQLSQMVETTKHLTDANVQVEKVYRKAWGMAHGCAGSYLEGVQP